MEISKRIKSLREEHGLTQEELAKELNISRNAISNYENGVRTPDLNVVRDLCDIFNITLESFFKEELVYKKTPKTKIIKLILQIAILVMLIVTCILSIVLFDKSYSNTRAVDDKTKVKDSNEISVINITNKIDSKTYEVEIIDKLKGDEFTYIIIKDKSIEVNISSNYLVFGNRLAKDSQYKNYVSFDVIEIYSPQYIQELSGDDVTNHPTVNYYRELINSEPKEDVLVSNLINPRKEEYIISSKDLYENPYDLFDLNEDFDVKFRDAFDYGLRQLDIVISLWTENKNLSKEIYLYNSDNISNYGNLEEYKVILENENNLNNKVAINYISIDVTTFFDNSTNIVIYYSYSSLFKSSWINNNLEVKLIYRK